MFVSISLTTYNRIELSKYCIDSILKQTPRDQYEFIIVDNGSTNDTVGMLKKYEKHIDKLVLNHKNNLGSAINTAWKLANPKAEWLIVFSNDIFCMNGWFENFKKIINSELNPDVVYCHVRTPDFNDHKILKTKNNGLYYIKKNSNWFGAGLAIKKELVEKYNFKFMEGKEPWSGGSIYSNIGKQINQHKLKIVHLWKPCALEQDGQYSNPKYAEYYKTVFSYKKRKGGKITYDKKHPKYESLRLKGGHMTNPDEYYQGSGYTIGKHYRAALNSKEGKAEIERLKKITEKYSKQKGKNKCLL